MNAYKVEAVVTENGTIVLCGLPFQPGDSVEVIVLEHSEALSASELRDPPIVVDAVDAEYLAALSTQMTEWASDADEAAYHDL